MESLTELCEFFIKERAVFIVKIDGQRESGDGSVNCYTVIISGGRLPLGECIRSDGSLLDSCISLCVNKYRRVSQGATPY